MELSNVGGIPLLAMGVPATPITLCTAITPCQLGLFPIVLIVPGAQFRVDLPGDPSLVGGHPTETLVVQFQ